MPGGYSDAHPFARPVNLQHAPKQYFPNRIANIGKPFASRPTGELKMAQASTTQINTRADILTLFKLRSLASGGQGF